VQRKLEEILRVLPGADTRLVHVEAAAQAEPNALEERHLAVREDALNVLPPGDAALPHDVGAVPFLNSTSGPVVDPRVTMPMGTGGLKGSNAPESQLSPPESTR